MNNTCLIFYRFENYFFIPKCEKFWTVYVLMFYRQWHPRDRSVQSVLNVTMTKTNVLGC